MAETELDRILSMDMGERVIFVPGIEEVTASMQRFKWPDYLMFSIMLLICIIIGIYFGIYQNSKTVQEYLMGSRKMEVFPVTLSLIASYVSGISILGIPTEIYLYGVQYMYILIGLAMMTFIMNYVYLPVFYNLQLTSIYEYLERRFDKNVRVFGSFLCIVNMIMWLGIVVYVPALAFNQVSGVNIHFVTPVFCTVCIFYTALGGLKAVVWTDTIQALIMLGAMFLVAVKGTIDIGGWNVVIERNLKSGRIEGPNLELSPYQRYNFWSLAIGGCILLLDIGGVNQNMLQRYMSLPSLQSAKRATWFFGMGLSLIVLICGYCGILTYATFYECDPLSTKLAKQKDQLLPILVMQVLGNYPCLPGIFVAGILSASLSSLSTGLNAMAAVVLEDFYPFFFTTPLTNKQSSFLIRSTVVILGIICVALVYIIEHLGAVLQISLSIGSIASGPSLGLFTMGILLPWINAKGALIGGSASLILMSWLCLKAQQSIATGEISFPEKPLTTKSCQYHFVPQHHINNNQNTTDFVSSDQPFMFHHISYLWYTLLGSTLSIIIGLVASLIIKQVDSRDIDRNLLSPCIIKFIQPRDFPNEPVDSIIHAYKQTKIQKELVLQEIQHVE